MIRIHIKNYIKCGIAIVGTCLLLSGMAAGTAYAASDPAAIAPGDFPQFYFAGHDQQSQLLDNYLWYHFSLRPGNNKVLFNKEYLTIGDMWLGGATDHQRSIQDVHRGYILDMQMDSEGYVYTHQHFSHAHEHGWPFPLWTQSFLNWENMNGKTYGWHFQKDGPGWIWDYMKLWKMPRYVGETAAKAWMLENVKSLGIADNKWQLESTGPSPAILMPKGVIIDSFQAPFLQLRWTRTGEPKNLMRPYVEWQRKEDTSFSPDRRVYFYADNEEQDKVTHTKHCMIEMYRHPKWTGKIKSIRISLAPGESDVKFAIDSFFTCYDTRHAINNPIYIFSCWNYFRWTGDIEFLRANIDKMRIALRYQQTEMGGLKYNHIRNTWPGHDGIAGFKLVSKRVKLSQAGHGIGNNYFDILPFGWDDMYSTSQYYASTIAMAKAEEAILAHPEWGIPRGALQLDPVFLRRHAARVKNVANAKFWDKKKGRFVACIDKKGIAHDYGFTFLNLDTIWYGIASDDHAKKIMDWISGKRIVQGDTSTGADIYHWKFGPRCSTKRNLDWYGQCWPIPETVKWGQQVQDGGAVLGFAFYDLWARLQSYGPDDAWQRFSEILAWEKEVQDAGGYREYYKGGKRGTSLQGGGTTGGIGIDCEFYESILIPSIVTYGFLGINPEAAKLVIDPRLPKACPEMGVSNILYHNVKLDIKASEKSINLQVKDVPPSPIRIVLRGNWRQLGTSEIGSTFELSNKGDYRFEKN